MYSSSHCIFCTCPVCALFSQHFRHFSSQIFLSFLLIHRYQICPQYGCAVICPASPRIHRSAPASRQSRSGTVSRQSQSGTDGCRCPGPVSLGRVLTVAAVRGPSVSVGYCLGRVLSAVSLSRVLSAVSLGRVLTVAAVRGPSVSVGYCQPSVLVES